MRNQGGGFVVPRLFVADTEAACASCAGAHEVRAEGVPPFGRLRVSVRPGVSRNPPVPFASSWSPARKCQHPPASQTPGPD